MKKFILSVLVTAVFSLCAHAQQFITTSLDVPEMPMAIFSVNGGDGSRIPSEGAKVSMHWQCFDEGQRTAIIHIEWPWFLEQYKQGRPNTKVLEFSYSGKELRLLKGRQNNVDYYMVSRGTKMLAMIATLPHDGKIINTVQINNTGDNPVIDDVYLGMNVDELKDLTSRTMKHSSVKFLYDEGNCKVYEVLWLGMRDTYRDWSGTQHAELHATEPFGRFWFDANGKLVKWYQCLEGSNM